MRPEPITFDAAKLPEPLARYADSLWQKPPVQRLKSSYFSEEYSHAVKLIFEYGISWDAVRIPAGLHPAGMLFASPRACTPRCGPSKTTMTGTG